MHASLVSVVAGLAALPASHLLAQDAPVAVTVPVHESPANPSHARQPAIVQLAICLDTSGSMDGLIDSARQKVWAIVNDLALAEPTPTLTVALLTYGNDGHDAEGGWVAVETDFTQDLDLVSERLFAYTTNGGTELVGRALDVANSLSWSSDDDALKLIVIAGNESADQDPKMSFRDVCRQTISRGIMVNAIYCGNPADDLAPAWREVAQLADGQFAAIDQDQGTVVVATPFDDQLAELSGLLNGTYYAFSADGRGAWTNQVAQDQNAALLSGAAVAQRAQTKATELYFCSWDIVDACNAGQLDLATLDPEELPEALQGKTPEELATFVKEKAQEREDIQGRINVLARQRAEFVEQEMVRLALDETKSLDFVIRQAIRAQAESKGIRFAPPAPASAHEGDAAGGE